MAFPTDGPSRARSRGLMADINESGLLVYLILTHRPRVLIVDHVENLIPYPWSESCRALSQPADSLRQRTAERIAGSRFEVLEMVKPRQ